MTIDEIGNGALIGGDTVERAADEMGKNGQLRPWYELSHPYSAKMPLSPFSAPVSFAFQPTTYIPPLLHAANGELTSGQFDSQGTKMDALGHFGHVDPDNVTRYFGGLTQDQVKPTDASPLLHLGIEHAPPIVTTAVLLDAKKFKGHSLAAGEQVTDADIRAMVAAQKLRDLLPGDLVLVYTGWEEKWQDDNPNPFQTEYYSAGPGLSKAAVEYLGSKKVACIGMDVPFLDAVNSGFLQNQAPPPADAPPGLPFYVHHYDLTQAGVYQVHNMHFAELAADRVYLSAAFVLPIRITGAANSAVRPIAIGRPYNPASP